MAVWTDQLAAVQRGRRCLGTTVQARRRWTVSRVRAGRPERSASTKCTRLHTQRTSRCSNGSDSTHRSRRRTGLSYVPADASAMVPCVHASLPPSTASRSVRPFLQRSIVCTTHRQTTLRHGICSNSPHSKLRMRSGLKSVRLCAPTDSAVGP